MPDIYVDERNITWRGRFPAVRAGARATCGETHAAGRRPWRNRTAIRGAQPWCAS